MFKFLTRLLLIAALVVPWATQAQELSDYNFRTGVDNDNSVWITLSNPTTLLGDGTYVDDSPASSITNIGFSFPFGDGNYSQFWVNANGMFSFSPSTTTTTTAGQFTSSYYSTALPKISGIARDMSTGSNGYIRYELVGTAPERILVCEFALSYTYGESYPGDVKWQIQLHEDSSKVVIVYGPTPATSPSAFQSGLASASDDIVILNPSTNTPIYLSSSHSTTYSTWHGAGRYYEFVRPVITCPKPLDINAEPSADELTLYWTPGGSETSWEVTLGSNVYTTTDTFYTVSNLTANTLYDASVRAICGAGDTSGYRYGSFRTSCVAISQLPYSNGFENDPYYLSGTTTYAEAFPNCWHRINDATGTYNYHPYISTTANYVHSGTNGMYWYHSTTSGYPQNEYAILPPIDPDSYDIADLTLSFWARTTSASYHPMPIVGVMTNPTDASTFTPVHTFANADITTDWQLFAVSLENYTGTGNYIAIKWPTPGATSVLAIDDIFLTDEWCDIPLDVTASSTTDEVTVSWASNGGTSWTVFLGEDTVSNITDTFYTFSNLTQNTEYNYGVSNDCTNGSSEFICGSIRTLCTLLDSLPYSYGFDDLATGSSSVRPVIPCWHHLNNGSTYFGWPYVSSTTPHSGTRNLYWYGSTTATTYGDYQIVVLPGIDTDIYPMNTLQLNFWARPSSTSYHPVFEVGVMSDPNDVSTFQNVQTVNVQNVTTWQEFTVMFGNYTGSGQFMAVRLNRPSSSYYAYTDDFTISEMPNCPPITTHHVTATASSARITWTYDHAYGTVPDGYEVSYGYADDNLVGATTVTTTDLELTLTSLDPDTNYLVSISPICGSSNGEAHTFNFSTQMLPCIEWDTTGGAAAGPADTVTVGTPGTSTTAVMPVNNGYNYSYTQHLILSSHVSFTGPTTISGIAFDYAYSQPMTHATNCQIYMGNTTRSTFTVSVPADSAFVPYSDLTLVYQGPLNCTTNGYNYFQFNQGAFQYDGTSNIVVAIVNNSGSYDGTSYVFRYETTNASTGGAMTHRVYNDNTPYGPTEMNAARANQSFWRTNMKLVTGGGGDCLATATCMAPAVNLIQDDNGDIELSWIPGYQESSWDVDYREAGSNTWSSLLTATTNTSHTVLLSDLQPNTQYYFRVSAICSDTTMSSTASFTTPCSYISIPYNYGFEDMATGSSSTRPNIPCWHHLNNGTSYPGYPYVSSTAHNSSRSLYWYLTTTTGTYGDYEVVVMPPVDIATTPINTLQLTFWAKPTSTSYAPVFLVGVMTDPTDITTFEFVDSVALDHTTTDWMPYESVLSNYTGTGRYIALRANRPSSAWYAYTDDFAIENAPACPRINGIDASNIGQTSATISWNATAASIYEVQYGPSGFTMGNGTIETNVSEDSIGLYGLTSNTAYDVYVRGICTDDTSNWSFVYTFRTACGLIATLPFNEDFESQPTGSSTTSSPFIPCWTRLNNGTSYGGYPYVSSSSSYNHTQGGTNGLYWYGSTTTGTYGDYQYIILPEIDTTVYPINTLQLSFWAKASSTSYYPVFQVGVMTSNTDTAFQLVSTINVSNNTEWGEYVTNLSDFAGSGDYIAIRALRPTSSWYSYVDDISLDVIPPCPRVLDLHAINATLDSITIVWTDTSSTNTSWVVEYDTVNFVPGDGTATTITVTDTIYDLSGLDSAHTYHIYVYPVCDEYIGYRHITAATLAASPASVPYICDFEEAGPNGWDFFNDGQANYWMVGSDANNGGTQSMYITNNGINNAYTNTVISYSYAVRTFNLSEAGEYAYTYDWRCQGESHNYDFARVFVTPASEMFTAGSVLGGSTYAFSTADCPANWIELTQSGATPNTLSQSSTWETVTGTFAITTPGKYKMVFVWANDGSGGSNPPIAIDNVALVQNVCPAVDDLSLAYVTIDSAILSWTSFAEQTSFIVEYDSVPFTAGSGSYIVVTTDTFYVMTGLTAGNTYHVLVRAECNGDTALASNLSFATLAALPATVPYSCDFEQAGVNGWDLINGTQDNYWIVGNATYNGGSRSLYITDNGTANSYSNGASYVFATRVFNLAAGNYICAYDWKCQGESSYDFIRAALVPASVQLTPGEYSGFDNSSAMPSGSIALDGGQRLNLQGSAWQNQVVEFTLATPGTYKIVFMWRNDGSIYNIPPAAIDNVQLVLNNCPMPQNIVINNLTQTGADLSWQEAGSATQWQYQLDNGTPVVVTDTFCTVTGLTANTAYVFRVRSICGIGDTGMWASYNFRTPCGSISLPYIQDFEAEATGSSTTGSAFANCMTRLNNGTSYGGYPYVGGSTYNHTVNGSKGLYWYNSTTTGTYGDYQCVVLPPVDQTVNVDSLQLSFWTRASSASYTPTFQIGVMTDPNNISTFVGVDTVTITSGITWTLVEIPLTVYSGTGQYVAIKSDRAVSSWYAYLDDIILEYAPSCLIPQNVVSTEASMTTITVDWTDLSAASEWEIRYGTNANNTTTVTTSSHPYTITGLDTLTSYNIEVRAVCTAGDTSRWSTVSVLGTEFCDNAFAASTGAMTGTSYYVPVNNYYKYTLTETIIDSAELAGIGDITAVAYSYAYSSASTDKTNVTIYLKPTSKSVFTSGSDIELLDSTAVQVYTGNLNCSQGWNYFIFDTLYTWDGHSNLMVIVDDNSNDYNSSSYVFNTSSCNGYKTLCWYSDSYDADPTNSTYSGTKTYYQYRPTMKLVSCNNMRCHAPSTLPATDVTYHSATVNWNSNATDFEVAVKAATDAIWPAETAVSNATSFAVDNLAPATQYQFRVRTICDAAEGLISDWVEGTFVTDSLPCFVPTDLHTTALGYTTATLAWTADASQNQWSIRVWTPANGTDFEVTSNPFTVTGLAAHTTYYAAIKAVCGGGYTESEYGDTIEFTTETCAQVTGVTVSQITVNSAVVSWNAVSAVRYEIEYGDRNFNQGTGTTIVVNEGTTYTLTGLLPDYDYSVFVRAYCEENVDGAWSDQVDFTTPQQGGGEGLLTVDGTATLSIFPNPTTDATTIAISGVNGEVEITIVDMNGRTVATETMSCEGDCTKRMEVSSLAQGAYFVRISGDSINAVKKLIVK